MLSFDILEKGLEIVSPPHFMYNFMSCYILLTDHISLSGCLCLLRY